MKQILHLSFHKGCNNEIKSIMKILNYNLTFLEFNDNTVGKYNIGYERAKKYWEKNKDYFNTFDIIITSDTAPLSRIFLQNNWNKKLIIWINNRFDYFDAATLDCKFPDKHYYDLFRQAIDRKNVRIIGYTNFENYYCKNFKNIDIGNLIIKPTGHISDVYNNFDRNENYKDTFFIGPYHNDNIMINLSKKLNLLNIKNYNGRYNGPYDLLNFKGIIHIPYSWSNYSFFEAMYLGIIYFIPSKNFLFKLKKNRDFFWSPPYKDKLIELSEWYLPEHKNLLIYFSSWTDLQNKIENTDYINQKQILKNFNKNHTNKMLHLWKNIL